MKRKLICLLTLVALVAVGVPAEVLAKNRAVADESGSIDKAARRAAQQARRANRAARQHPALFHAASASATQYLLDAGRWRKKHTQAVRAAGGELVFAHGPTGLALAVSSNPDFLDEVTGAASFLFAEEDVFVDWDQPPLVESVVTPGDETFFPLQWNMVAIDAPGAWAAGCDGSGARVAVIDGGLYHIHPDIAPNLDAACSASFVPGVPYTTDTGTFWHGTHVAGIVLGADNGFGIIGVAPGATLMHLKALHAGSGSFGAVIGAVLFAADPASFGAGCTQRADIINMSLGALFFKSSFPGFHSAAAKAVNFAGSRGVLVISAAANNGLDIGQFADLTVIPAQSGSGLAISATGPVDFANGGSNYRRIASYTNYGEDLVTLAAPGGDFTLFPVGAWFLDMVLSTCRGTSTPPTFSFCFAAGTSMASPAAAGVAALIKGANPGISKGALKTKLMNTADDEGKVGKDEFYGHGFVNARRACTE
ncbi:MAG: S8 family serine peptidase [Thermoanaerobaculia bacterium]|nr:S8 family serine peptidase [Thermoanaerobaculia bacterium]